jgi:hypothetical protein
VRLYHRTDAGEEILSRGFRDGDGGYLTRNTYRGVWLSNQPLDVNEGAIGRTLLAVEVPEAIVAEWEWVEEGKGFREFLVPAELVNEYGPPIIVSEED